MNIQAIRDGISKLACPARVAYRERLKLIDSEATGGLVRCNGAYVKEVRLLAKKYWQRLSFEDIHALYQSHVYEERLCATLALVWMHKVKPEQAYNWYLANLDCMPSWEMIDLAGGCENKICGEYLRDKDKTEFMKLANSPDWWWRRLTVNATWSWVRGDKDFGWTFRLARKFRDDPHHLVLQVVGCLLRQVGIVDQSALSQFLLDPLNHPLPRATIKLATYRPERLNVLYAPAVALAKQVPRRVDSI